MRHRYVYLAPASFTAKRDLIGAESEVKEAQLLHDCDPSKETRIALKKAEAWYATCLAYFNEAGNQAA